MARRADTNDMNIFDLLDDTPPTVKPTRKRVPLTPPFVPTPKTNVPEIMLEDLLGASNDDDKQLPTRPRLVPPAGAEERIFIPDDVDESVNVSGGSGDPIDAGRPRLSPMQTITPRPVMDAPENDQSRVQLSPYDDINQTPLEYERKRLGSLTNKEMNPVRNKEAQTIDPKTGKPGKANFGGRLKDALREALIGAGRQVAANGGVANWGTLGAAAAGGVGGAIDPSMNEQRQREYDIAQSQGRVGELERQRGADQDYDAGQVKQAYDLERIRASQESEAIRRNDLERKTKEGEAKTKYYERKADQGDLKLIGDDELRELRDKWASQDNAVARRRLDLVEKEIGVRQQEGEANRTSREKIAGMRESGINNRSAESRKDSVRKFITSQKMSRAKFEASLKAKGLSPEQVKVAMSDYPEDVEF